MNCRAMIRIPYVLMLSVFLACVSVSDIYAQAPGGVSTGLAAWYRADAQSTLFSDAGTTIATDGNTIQQWNDFLGSTYNLSQSIAGLRPGFSNITTQSNFNSTVMFSGSLLEVGAGSSDIIDRATGTLYVAGKMTKFGAAGLAGFDATMDYPGLHTGTGANTDKLMFYTQSSGFTTLSTNSFNNVTPFIAGSSWENGAGSTATYPLAHVWLNGNENVYNNTLNNVNISGVRSFRIGEDSNWGSHNGQINEVIIFENPLTQAERTRLESYLAIKYGITSNGDYVNSANTTVWNVSAYQNNVVGIARDNVGALHQKQSRSENPNQKLIIGNGGSLFNTNNTNTNDLTDGQFLIIGDNGLAQQLKTLLAYTTGTNGETNFRFEAIWKAQNTNSVGSVIVAWPKGVENLYLVQSTDETIDNTDTFTPMTNEVTVNGVVYNTATVTLTDGQFFTFAGFAYAPGGVSGPDFWIKSDDAGNIATAWKDHSTNADDIPNVGGVNLSPADRNHNFHPYSTGYTASKFFYNSTSLMNPLGNVELPNTNTSVFSAVQPTAANATGRIIGIDDDLNASEPALSIANGRPRQYEFFATTTSSDFSTAFNVGQSNIFSALANNTVANGGTSAIAGGEKRLGLNGTYESFSGFAAANRFQIYGTNLRIGHAGWDAPGPFPGDIMEVVWYNRTLTPNEQSRVNTYLAVKNGVTLAEDYLAADGSVLWNRTANTGYNSNIFGVARDNTSGLHQKQAASTSLNQKLIIGHGSSLFDTNAANTNDLAEGQFLMVGDNGLRQGLSIPLAYTAGANGETNFRFEAIWKAQNTDGVGQVTIAWPKQINNLYLVQSADETIDNTDMFTPMTNEITINGIVYNTATVTINNGEYFTLAGFGHAPGGVINALSYWYRADKNADNTGAGTDVTAWTDFFSGTISSQISTAPLPKYEEGAVNYFNYNTGVNFTDNAQMIGNLSVATLSALEFDIFTFTKEGMTGTRYFNVGRDNSSFSSDNWDSPGFYTNGTVASRNNTGGGTVITNPGGIAFDTNIPSIMYHTFTDINMSKGLNGDVTGSVSAYSARGQMVGGHIFGSNRGVTPPGGDDFGFVGDIGETIVYGSGNLSTVERRRVDSYLAIKYGVTLGRVDTEHYLGSDESIIWNGGTNAVYNNNIFGFAKDDISAFEQKVARSVNAAGNILTVATTDNFTLPNLDASRTGFANDKTYFLLGDNNVTATPLVDLTLAGNDGHRIQRIWLSQRTNTPSMLSFEADLSTYGSLFTSGNNVYMLVADDAGFTTNVSQIAGAFTAGKWVFNHDFDGDAAVRYITFAEVSTTYCVQLGAGGTPISFTQVGISDRAGFASGWPENIPNGFITIESETSGFVITRVQQVSDIADPQEGMLVYEIQDQCIKLYNGTLWNCIQRSCNE